MATKALINYFFVTIKVGRNGIDANKNVAHLLGVLFDTTYVIALLAIVLKCCQTVMERKVLTCALSKLDQVAYSYSKCQ